MWRYLKPNAAQKHDTTFSHDNESRPKILTFSLMLLLGRRKNWSRMRQKSPSWKIRHRVSSKTSPVLSYFFFFLLNSTLIFHSVQIQWVLFLLQPSNDFNHPFAMRYFKVHSWQHNKSVLPSFWLEYRCFLWKVLPKGRTLPPFPSKTEAKRCEKCSLPPPPPLAEITHHNGIIRRNHFLWLILQQMIFLRRLLRLLPSDFAAIVLSCLCSYHQHLVVRPIVISSLLLCRCVETRSDFINICIWYQDIVLIRIFTLLDCSRKVHKSCCCSAFVIHFPVPLCFCLILSLLTLSGLWGTFT